MRIYHITRRRMIVTAAALVLVAGLSIMLAGCHGKEDTAKQTGILAATDADRIAFLEDLGWQVDGEPMETLDLQLPEDLADSWAEYVALQTGQGLPFANYAGQNVRRYTYRINNYPSVTKGVQANLYLCGDEIIGGDIISTGKNGFQAGLQFPES